MSKILITGGAGLLGHALVDLLNEVRGHKFCVVDNLLYVDDYLRNVPFQYGNVGDEDFFVPFLKQHNFDIVVHLAGVVGDSACSNNPIEAYEVNIESVKILKKYFKGKIIFPSSASVYGANQDIVTESSPTNPLSIYAEMKLECEKILSDTNALILRLGTLHGITGRIRNDLVVNALTMNALITKEISVFGGNQYRPLLHVRDIASIILQMTALERKGIYNILENNYTVMELAEQIRSELPDTEIVVTKTLFEDRRNYRMSGQKAKEELSIVPQLKPIDSIRDIVKVYKEGRVKDLLDARYRN